jgi:hypothetical protein
MGVSFSVAPKRVTNSRQRFGWLVQLHFYWLAEPIAAGVIGSGSAAPIPKPANQAHPQCPHLDRAPPYFDQALSEIEAKYCIDKSLFTDQLHEAVPEDAARVQYCTRQEPMAHRETRLVRSRVPAHSTSGASILLAAAGKACSLSRRRACPSRLSRRSGARLRRPRRSCCRRASRCSPSHARFPRLQAVRRGIGS